MFNVDIWNDQHVIQHDMANPPMFTTISVIPVLPRFAVELVSDAHTGAVAVFMPFPIPAMTLQCQLARFGEEAVVNFIYRPAVMIPKSEARN